MSLKTIFALVMVWGPCTLWAHPLKVTTTFTVLKDMAEAVGGNEVQVTSLVGAGGDVHVFEPSPKIAKTILASDIVIINGLNLEPWFERLIKAAGYTGPIIVATKGITPLMLDGDIPDPHCWHDPTLGMYYIKNITAGLCTAAPDTCGYFTSRRDQYMRTLRTTHETITKNLQPFTNKHPIIVTTHDAFSYMERALGIRFIAPQGISTEQDVSAKTMAWIIEQVKLNQASAIFVENSTNPKIVQQISRETGVPVGGTLYADALSQPGTDGDTYIKMLMANAAHIIQALSTPVSADN